MFSHRNHHRVPCLTELWCWLPRCQAVTCRLQLIRMQLITVLMSTASSLCMQMHIWAISYPFQSKPGEKSVNQSSFAADYKTGSWRDLFLNGFRLISFQMFSGNWLLHYYTWKLHHFIMLFTECNRERNLKCSCKIWIKYIINTKGSGKCFIVPLTLKCSK